ncbi:hypothetical protein VZT92_010313 [Zoarces viviparus]|uniref:Uncharacterized protein n=1 Tax=Zoarces viviparus TaxID=48416 RepID=A0AAW1FDN6_ZOAVI
MSSWSCSCAAPMGSDQSQSWVHQWEQEKEYIVAWCKPNELLLTFYRTNPPLTPASIQEQNPEVSSE